MAYTSFRARPTGLANRAAFGVGSLVSRVSAWNQSRRTYNALSQLSAHELEDIGLSRGDIDRISNRQF